MAQTTRNLSVERTDKKDYSIETTLQRMKENDDVGEYFRVFFDTVDKLNEMKVDINRDLLSVMLLHSLPFSFENF